MIIIGPSDHKIDQEISEIMSHQGYSQNQGETSEYLFFNLCISKSKETEEQMIRILLHYD